MDVLLRFQYHKIGVVADMGKEFHQVSIAKEYHDFTFYLDRRYFAWQLKVVDRPTYCPELSWVSTQVSFVLNATIDHHIRSYAVDPSVDDLKGGATRKDAIELFSKSSRRMSEGGFILRKWKTNDQELRKLIVETEHCKTHTGGKTKITEDEITDNICGGYDSQFRSIGSSNSTNVLGVVWETSTDQLTVATGTQFEGNQATVYETTFTSRHSKAVRSSGINSTHNMAHETTFSTSLCGETWLGHKNLMFSINTR